jgi:thiol:disulfide interchange protein DsbA
MMLCLMPAGLRAADALFVEGTHYERLPEPVRTADPARIEVVELFWYGCSHCFQFEPLLAKWEPALAKDVDFHRSPAMWNKLMAVHAQAFYAAEALGVLNKLNQPLFEALNVQRKRLVANGVTDADFRKAFNSFGVHSKVKQADARQRSYKTTGTPEMIVNGKFRVSARLAGSPESMLKVVDFLIAKERAGKTGG